MDIPEINMITDFGAGMKCLQNPSLISRFPLVEKSPHVYSFWKWGALFFAIFATFGSIIRRIKLIFIYFHSFKSSSSRAEDILTDSWDDDDVSLASSDADLEDDDDQEEDTRPTTSFRGQHRVDEDFRVKGSSLCFKNQWQNGQLRQRRRRNVGDNWSEIASGKNVVKLWDSLGLSLDFDQDLVIGDSESVVSLWDFDNRKTNFPASPALVLTAEATGKRDGLIFGGYDTRMPSRAPALHGEWSSTNADVSSGTAGGVGKFYIRDDVSGVLTVGDVRNMRKPLESVRESDGDTWWDADAVIVEEEFDRSG